MNAASKSLLMVAMLAISSVAVVGGAQAQILGETQAAAGAAADAITTCASSEGTDCDDAVNGVLDDEGFGIPGAAINDADALAIDLIAFSQNFNPSTGQCDDPGASGQVNEMVCPELQNVVIDPDAYTFEVSAAGIFIDVDIDDDSIDEEHGKTVMYIQTPVPPGVPDFAGFPDEQGYNFNEIHIKMSEDDIPDPVYYKYSDLDDDGFSEYEEANCPGQPTNPFNGAADCDDWDGDGKSNADELVDGSDPRVPNVVISNFAFTDTGVEDHAFEAPKTVTFTYDCDGSADIHLLRKVDNGAWAGVDGGSSNGYQPTEGGCDGSSITVLKAGATLEQVERNPNQVAREVAYKLSTSRTDGAGFESNVINFTLLPNEKPDTTFEEEGVLCDAGQGNIDPCTNANHDVAEVSHTFYVNNYAANTTDGFNNETNQGISVTAYAFDSANDPIDMDGNPDGGDNGLRLEDDGTGNFTKSFAFAPGDYTYYAIVTDTGTATNQTVTRSFTVNAADPCADGVTDPVGPGIITYIGCIISGNSPQPPDEAPNPTPYLTNDECNLAADIAEEQDGWNGCDAAGDDSGIGIPYDQTGRNEDGDVEEGGNGQADAVENYVAYYDENDGRTTIHVMSPPDGLRPSTADAASVSIGDSDATDDARESLVVFANGAYHCFYSQDGPNYYGTSSDSEAAACADKTSFTGGALVEEAELTVIVVDENSDNVPERIDITVLDPNGCGFGADPTTGPECDGSTISVSLPPGEDGGIDPVELLFPSDDPDEDGDGVPDEDDACEDTPEGEEVDENGCPVPPSPTDPCAPGFDFDPTACEDFPPEGIPEVDPEDLAPEPACEGVEGVLQICIADHGGAVTGTLGLGFGVKVNIAHINGPLL